MTKAQALDVGRIDADAAPSAILDPSTIAARLERLDSYIFCARMAAEAGNSNEGHAVGDLLLHVQNLIYDLRLAIDPSIDPDVSAGGAA